MLSARPISTMRPRYMTATFWLTSSTTGRSCEMNRYVSPRSFCRSRSRFTTCAWIEMSSALVGNDQARAHREHARDPHPALLAAGKFRGKVRELAVLETHLLQQLADADCDFAVARALVHGERLAQDVAHAHLGVQASVEVLEDHLHLAPQRAQLGAAQGGDVAPVEHDTPAAGVGQPQHRASYRGLAAAGLADQADGLVFPEIKAHAVHCRDHAPLTGQHRDQAAALTVFLAQIGDFKNGAVHAFPV